MLVRLSLSVLAPRGQLATVARAVRHVARDQPGGSAGGAVEWLADDALEGQRLARGGSWADYRFALESVAPDADLLRDPDYEGADVGFRLVRLPAPGARAAHLVALAALAALRASRVATLARDGSP